MARLELTQGQMKAVSELCVKFGVSRLRLFGSAVAGEFGPESDLDFVAVFIRPTPLGAANQYFGFKKEIEALFARPADVLVDAAIENPHIRKSIEDTAITLYAA